MEEEQKYVRWSIVDFCDFRRTVAFIVLPEGQILCHGGFAYRRESRVGFLFCRNLANTVILFTISARV